MMRTRFTVTTIRSTAATLLGLLVAACSSDGGNATATEGNGSSETGTASVTDSDTVSASNSNSNSASVTDTTPTTEGTATDPDSSSTDPTVADSSSSGGDGCTEKDECIEDTDCAPGQTCIGCLCLGEPTGCAQWGEGAYGNCAADGQAACMSDAGGCIGNGDPGVGVCFFSDCTEPCDCPQPPKGFETQVACESISAGDDSLDCFIECGGGLECPEGMGCIGNTICMFGVDIQPAYGDCINNVGAACEGGNCIVTNMEGSAGWCAPACDAVGDCPVPETGTAEVICTDVTDDMMNECLLNCAEGLICPDGMVCDAGFNICIWEEVVPPPPPWGDCETMPVEEACAPTDTCIDTPEGGICGGACEDATECPAAPDTGDAVVTCADLGAGNVCHLSCAMGETCPDGTECFNDQYCHFPAA